MSGLSVAGIASGIDSDSIIAQLVGLEQSRVTGFQRRIAQEEAERVLFTDISGRLQSLRTATSSFSSDSLFSTLSSSSSDTDILTVSATSDAPLGRHTIKVLQTATAHRIGGTGVEDTSDTRIAVSDSAIVNKTFAGTTLGSMAADDFEITKATASDYDLSSNVQVTGTFEENNAAVIVEVTDDYIGSGNLKVRYSFDGGTSFFSETIDTDAGNKTLDLSGEAGTSFKIDFNNLTGKKLTDGDTFEFMARSTASLEFKVGDGERQIVTLDQDDTLDELVRKINDGTGLGLRADILNDGSFTDPFRLILTSLTEGNAGEIDILHNGSTIELEQESVEGPATDSSGYTGNITTASSLYAGGLGNSSLVLEFTDNVTLSGSISNFRVSVDGGLTFHTHASNSITSAGTLFSLDLGTLKDSDGNSLFASDPGNDITFEAGSFASGDRVTMDFFDPEIQSAQDALVNVNGINLVKSGNVVDDVFDGMTLNLKTADANETVTVDITEKTGDISSAMSGFVEAYNNVMSVLNAQSSFNPDDDESAPLLMGDATVRQIQSGLQRYVTGRISILGSDTISSLADVGITTDSKTGQLSFNSSKLQTAINSDSTAVRRLLSRFGDLIDGANAEFVSSTSTTKAGTYKVQVTQARSRALVEGTQDGFELTDQLGSALDLVVRINSDAQGLEGGNVISTNFRFDAGDQTIEDIITKMNEQFAFREMAIEAELVDGKLTFEATEYGDDFKIDVYNQNGNNEFDFQNNSNNSGGAAGASSDAATSTGTDLKGKINGVTVDSEGDVLVGTNGFAFEGLRIRIPNDYVDSATSLAGTIRVNDGLGSSFTKLLDSFVGTDGTINTRLKSFDSTVSRLEEQIGRVNERATLLEDRLRKQFVNLETTLGRLNATGSFLTEQLKALPGIQIKRK